MGQLYMIASQTQTLISILFFNQKIYLKKVPRGLMGSYRITYWLWAIQKFNSYFDDFGKIKKLVVLGWLLLAWLLLTFSFCKTTDWMLRWLLFFIYWLPMHSVFLFTPFSQHSQLSCLWLPTPDCAAPAWLTAHHATPLVTRCFPPQSLTSSLTLPWAISRFLNPFYTFSPAHCRVIWNFSQTSN